MGRGSAGVHDVAALIIERQHAGGRSIDKMQLQKLLYVVQQAHIALAATTAFDATFRAYERGPVIEAVEQTYRNASVGTEPIPQPLGGHPDRVPAELVATVDEVLSVFGTWTGPNLERYVKVAGSPWRVARGDLPRSAASRNEISLRDITVWAVTHPLVPGTPRGDKYDPGDDLASDDQWFFDAGWVEGERKADEDISAGRVTVFEDIDALLSDLG